MNRNRLLMLVCEALALFVIIWPSTPALTERSHSASEGITLNSSTHISSPELSIVLPWTVFNWIVLAKIVWFAIKLGMNMVAQDECFNDAPTFYLKSLVVRVYLSFERSGALRHTIEGLLSSNWVYFSKTDELSKSYFAECFLLSPVTRWSTW